MSFQPGIAAEDTEDILDAIPSGHVSLKNAQPLSGEKILLL